MPHISLRSFAASYGSHTVLQGITVDIPDGEITAIIGPSGCGKTTLLKSLNRLLDLHDDLTVAGKVFIDGVDIYDPKADVLALRKKVGFLAQHPYPLPMSIYDNVAFGPRIHGIDPKGLSLRLQGAGGGPSADSIPPMASVDGLDDLVEYYLRLAGLWDEVKDRLRAPAARLSIGQQQRLALARTLSVEPEVILADEATSALDPISAKLVEDRFRALKKDYTIVMVTHILRQARRLADYIVFMYLGELVEHGPADRFFSSPQHEKTRAYISGEIS